MLELDLRNWAVTDCSDACTACRLIGPLVTGCSSGSLEAAPAVQVTGQFPVGVPSPTQPLLRKLCSGYLVSKPQPVLRGRAQPVLPREAKQWFLKKEKGRMVSPSPRLDPGGPRWVGWASEGLHGLNCELLWEQLYWACVAGYS